MQVRYTSKQLDDILLRFVPHYKLSKMGRTTAIEKACINAFLTNEVQTDDAKVLRQAMNDLREAGFFTFED